MKNALLISLISVFILSCKIPSDCSNFKVGKYKYVNPNINIEIVRNDTLQVEKDLDNGWDIYTSIEWSSDCEYTLTYLKIVNAEEYMNQLIGQRIDVEIVETSDKSYVARVKSKRIDNELIEFIKID